MTNEERARDIMRRVSKWAADGPEAAGIVAMALVDAEQRGAAAVSCRMSDAIAAAEQRGREQAEARIAELEGALRVVRDYNWAAGEGTIAAVEMTEIARAALAKGG